MAVDAAAKGSMGILGRRKNEYLSENCLLKNILKYAAFTSWVQKENSHLVDLLEQFFTQNCNSDHGWLRQVFGHRLISNESAVFDILVFLRALMAGRCKNKPILYVLILRSWGESDDAPFRLNEHGMVTKYFQNVDAGLNDVRLTTAALDDVRKAFENPSYLIQLVLANKKSGSLRRRWIQNPKSHLKPTEVKLFRLQACLLLGSPEIVGEAQSSVLKLLRQTWNTTEFPVKKHVAQYYKSNPWLENEVAVRDDAAMTENPIQEVSTPPIARLSGDKQSAQVLVASPNLQHSSPDRMSLRQRMTSVIRRSLGARAKSSTRGANERNQSHIYDVYSTSAADTPLRHHSTIGSSQQHWELPDNDENLTYHADEYVGGVWGSPRNLLQDDFSLCSDAAPAPSSHDEQLSFGACDDPLVASFPESSEIIVNDKDQDDSEIVDSQRAKYAEKVLKSVLDLAGQGCPRVRNTMETLLLGNIPVATSSQYLVQNGYAEQRRAIVKANREARLAQQRRAIAKANKRKAQNEKEQEVEAAEDEVEQGVNDQELANVPSKSRGYDKPLCNWGTNKRRREDFSRLYAGKDIRGHKTFRATKITHEQADCFACFVAKNCQFRPGKSRNSKLKGVKMMAMPFYIRYGSLDGHYKLYREFAGKTLSFGKNLFNQAMKAVTATGTFNSGLSYFWTDFIELITLAIKIAERLNRVVDDLLALYPAPVPNRLLVKKKQAKIWIDASVELTKFTSLFLRHTFYGTLEQSSTNGYRCMRHALGEECNHEHEFPREDNLPIALSAHVVLNQAVRCVVELLEACNQEGRVEAPFVSELVNELASMTDFATIMQMEVLHFAKHTVRQRWQDLAERELENTMRGNPSIKRAKCDHKNKTLAVKLHEPMSEYFSKHGMSDFGTYLTWWGEKEGVEGWFSMYIDMIMENTTSQESRDLLPCVEALVEEIQHVETRDLIGPTTTLLLGTDNALTSLEVSVYISLLNRQNLSLQIERWDNKEAQTFKFQGDTHFHFVNMWIAKAIMHGSLKLSCPRSMFDCLAYDGGMKASTTILLRERHEAQEVHDLCKGCLTKKDRDGIKSVHCQSYESDSLVTTFFSNLPVGKTVIPCTQFDGVLNAFDDDVEELGSQRESRCVLPRTGDILRRHQSQKGINFTPFESAKAKPDETAPDQNTLAGRIYTSLLKYSSGQNFDFFDPQKHTGTPAVYGSEVAEVSELTKEARLGLLLSKFQASSPSAFETFDMQFPPSLDIFWAKKKNRTYLDIKPEVKQKVHEMYEQGVGYKNKNLRYTAEQATSELLHTILVTLWDQKYVCRVSKIKSIFGAKFRDTQKQQDGAQEANLSTAEASRITFLTLLKGNEDAERALMSAMGHNTVDESGARTDNNSNTLPIDEATLAHFGKLSRPLLQDFVRARDSLEVKELPKNKGTVADAKRGEDNLIARAWNLRCEPVRSDIVVTPIRQPEQADHDNTGAEYDNIDEFISELALEYLDDAFPDDSDSDDSSTSSADNSTSSDDRVHELREQNQDAENKLVAVMKRSTSIDDAGVSHFTKLTEEQLIAFIQARDQETMVGGSKTLPKKKGNSKNMNCLVGVAFSLRSTAVAWPEDT